MKSLACSGRPDVAFMLWDHAEMLYGVIFDASVLNILLETIHLFMSPIEMKWSSLRLAPDHGT
ncbi:hypothetical protein BDM02DRAFT_3115912 [Thelephora ganbajun]|uniref:Uncharacterized protein n=1 Tax=Thelephora ganbajun TaxID=370292 RepID=A0ACB6ZFC8_THEGA|nr:hypothetical protein BDM02DRAFT_3115912 [Thelephora ganbajun]